MKRQQKLLCTLLVGLLSVPAHATDFSHLKLKELTGFRLTLLTSNVVGKDGVCVAGYAFDPEEAKAVAVGLVLSAQTAEVRWAAAVGPSDGFHQNRFTGCFEVADKVWFIEESDTQASPELSQVMVGLASTKRPKTGAVERRPIWFEGKRNWLAGLSSDGERTTILLGHDPGTGTSSVGMSLHQLDGPNLATEPPTMVKHGSFLAGSKVTFDGKRFLIGGRFAKSGLDIDASMAKAAVSKSGNYIWAKPLGSSVLVTGPDVQGHLYEVGPMGMPGRVLIAELAEIAAPGNPVTLANPECLVQWNVPHVALVSTSCVKDQMTIQYLANSNQKAVTLALPKISYGVRTAVLYSPFESGEEGFSIGVITP